MNYENMDKEKLIKIVRKKDDMLKTLALQKEKLKYYANIDVMTKALNRRAGLELLNGKFQDSRVNGENLIVCFADVDRLKDINDTFGHEEGDKSLINLSEFIRENIRETDFVIRMGGDEFVVVFSNTTIKDVEKIWDRIYENMEKNNKNNFEYNLDFSWGLCEYKQEIQGEIRIKDLIKKADEEMYKKKMQKKKGF